MSVALSMAGVAIRLTTAARDASLSSVSVMMSRRHCLLLLLLHQLLRLFRYLKMDAAVTVLLAKEVPSIHAARSTVGAATRTATVLLQMAASRSSEFAAADPRRHPLSAPMTAAAKRKEENFLAPRARDQNLILAARDTDGADLQTGIARWKTVVSLNMEHALRK